MSLTQSKIINLFSVDWKEAGVQLFIIKRNYSLQHKNSWPGTKRAYNSLESDMYNLQIPCASQMRLVVLVSALRCPKGQAKNWCGKTQIKSLLISLEKRCWLGMKRVSVSHGTRSFLDFSHVGGFSYAFGRDTLFPGRGVNPHLNSACATGRDAISC